MSHNFDEIFGASCTTEVLLEKKIIKYKEAYQRLYSQWDWLTDIIFEKGGQEFLENATLEPTFTQEELRFLIQQVHPDKHNNSKISSDVMVKLLSMRK